MDLLKQCQQWFEQDEAQKVIDTLEAIPAEERTPELDSELAKAYIAVADIGEREPFEKALELLAPHESILPKITAGIIGLLPLIIAWMRKVPPCVTLKRPWKPVPETKIPRSA